MIGEITATAHDLVDEVTTLTDDAVTLTEIAEAVWPIALAVTAGAGAIKLPSWLRNFNLRKTARKAEQIATNLDTLATDDIEDIIADAVGAALTQFAASQTERDSQAWKRHDDCHEEIDAKLNRLCADHQSLTSTLIRIDKNVSYLQGHMKAAKN